MREYPLIQGPPESRIILRDFDAPINLAENYVQRLTSYLQVSLSGNYTFYAACDDMCELWKYDVTERGFGRVKIESGESATNQPIIYVKKWTEYLRWDKYPEQTSQPIVLSKCRFYRMVIFGREKDGNDHISVGMRNPSGEYERPITGERLFWTKPGTRNLEMSLKNHKTSISAFVGSNLLITGYYKFCCEGVYCPDCPLELNISCLGQNLKVNSAVSLSCVNTSFEVVFNTIGQPGNFTLKASYSFVEHPEEILEERVLGQVDLRAVVLEECYFESGKCDWTSPHANSKWKLFPDNFVYINGSYKAQLQSPVLLWEQFHQVVGLCLRFTYLIPVKSKSTIKVLLREPRKEEPILAWQLSGYHGTKWSVAEVSLPGATAVQIIFEGEGFLHNQVNAAIKNVIVTTEKCGLLPYFAKPGFSCGNKQFQCKNGECVKKNLRCDGDFACTDDSDEDNCECPSNKFACLDGKCLPASAVCNGINDCPNGDDENNCRNKCPFKHRCLDGSCIAWSETCIREPFCKDGTNTPSVCGSGKCRLNDLACSSKESKGPIRCKSFRRFCNFENDLCQLNPDMNATFQWITGAGETPTEKTGPSYDHSTLSKDGSYIYIEASPQRPGDVARLLSEWMEPNQSACVQFWYHMYGSDIGNLSFYLRTDQSETLVWRLSSDQGDRWKFGQFPLISERAHRFVIEGTTGDGSEGDIAIDDMSVLDGNCKKIIAQDSPDCSFREDTCDWETREGWTLSKHSPDLDLKNYGPGVSFIFLRAGASEVPHTLSSPIINTNEWKCLRLWYFIGATNLYKTSLQVFLQSLISNLSTLLFFVDEMASATNYTQIPLPGNYSKAKLKFFGIYEEFGDQILAIEQVSFSKEPCDPISWRQNDINEPLGMQNGEIVDTQISSSSSIDEAHAASRGRLHLNATSGKAGAWSAGRNDNSQWLQVDLRNNNVRVTGVATQGRNGRYAQWVTNYKLQYSNDGVNFQFYKKPEHTALEDFAGNKDQDSVVYHELKLPIRARFIRLQPEAWYRQISMRVELYGHQKECQKALGMEDNGISDGQIRASSSWDGNTVASRGRLSIKASGRMRGSWTASAKNSHQWLQIDLGANDNIVTGVATQGRQDADQWVTSYKLQYGNDGFNFQYYKDQGEDKVFDGNSDRSTIVFHELEPPIKARFVRFRPQVWFNHVSMRVELYGCQVKPLECQEPLGLENSSVTDGQLSSSSQLDDAHAAMQGRLNSNATGGSGGSWSAGNNNSSQWLQIDLLDQSNNVTRVATQGRHDASQWVTKYRLQYSEDGKIFHFYREPGDTAAKVFDGNKDQNSIVYNEINPPITTRFIRLQPVSWHGHISMRVELYGCQDDRPCDASVDSCGWNIARGWRRKKFRDLDNSYLNANVDIGSDGIIGDENYEIQLFDSSRGYISVSDIRQAKGGFTICFWLKTSNVGFFIEYRTAASGDRNETLIFGLYCGNNTFDILLRNQESQYLMGVTDNSWHYVCVLWDGTIGILAVFKDGHRNFKEARRRAPNSEYWNEGTMTVGFRKTNNSNSAVLGKLSGLNIWSYPVSITEILSMSYGCGTEAGDSKSWETVRDKIIGEVEVKDSRTCKDRKASRLVAEGIRVHVNQSALFMSPLYDASRGGQSRCLRFRYMLQGPGEKALTVYRKAKKYREIPIWISKGITRGNWVYGQVQLSSISDFQVLIKAEMGSGEDLIALTGLYIDEGKNCRVTPLSAKKACSENLINETGYFFSPSYPGNPPDDTFCKWHITVQKNHIIRLEFQEFLLTNHPTCERCFLQIFDGRDLSATAIGKFCGYMHPPVVISSSSHFTIVFRCLEGLRMTRFKAFYHSIRTQYWEGSSCSLHRECPSSCECKEFGEVYDKRILIIGEKLLAIPSNLPPNTGAVVFRQNRISQLHEKEFSDLTILEYIDLSFNNLLHLDEECFHNVSSVTTLRLNSNFLRILPIGVFSELPNLKDLDLGNNLLSSMRSGVFDALSNLHVLGLRANQLTNLQYGVFGNKSNMTHLYLQENKLTALPNGLFQDLFKLEVLNLSSNELKTVTKETLQGLSALKYLYLDNNRLANVPTDAFNELTSLKYLKLDHFILCCYAEKSVEGVTCDSPADEFSSCDDLMKNKTLQICIWILGILAFLGNLLVITWRIIDKEENRVHSFLLTNLAVADMFMGVYLLTIAIVDARWQGEYFKHDTKWRAGKGCQVIGVLSMLSSEVSVLILTVITIDRFVCIIFPFKFKRLTYKSAVFTCAVVWILGVVISVIPIIGIDYFYDKSGDFGFYSRSAVCLPLQLSEGTPAGWEYSASFFIGLNFISFTFILVAYILMFWTVKRSARAVRSASMNKESAMAKRLIFIVMTDFCCWMPIIIISILSLTGNFFDPHKIAFVWIAVFVLPLNSSLNPILYTFSTERAKRSLARKRKNVTGMVMKSLDSRAGDQSMDCLRKNAENTLVSIAESSPRPVKKIVEKQEQQSKQLKTKLKLIEVLDIFQEDTTGKRSTGYVTAWCEEEGVLGMVLLKYFGKEMKEDWTREVDVVQGLSSNEDPQDNLLHYRWHSKASEQSIEHGKKKIHGIQGSSWLICYDFESSSTLGDFLSEKGIVIDLDAVCAVVCDVITAIEHLLDHGIAHNNITTGNILIRQCPRVPPIKAVLGGFSQASKANDAGAFTNSAADEQSCHSQDIKQFGHLLATLLGHCHGSSEYVKLREIMNLCFEDTEEKRPTARYIREVLEETWRAEGVWDT